MKRSKSFQFRIGTMLLIVAVTAFVLAFIRHNQVERMRIDQLRKHPAVLNTEYLESCHLEPGLVPLLWHCLIRLSGFHRLGEVDLDGYGSNQNDGVRPDFTHFDDLKSVVVHCPSVRHAKLESEFDFSSLGEAASVRQLAIYGVANETLLQANLPSLEVISVHGEPNDFEYFPYGVSIRTCELIHEFACKRPNLRLAVVPIDAQQTEEISVANPYCRCVILMVPKLLHFLTEHFRIPVYERKK